MKVYSFSEARQRFAGLLQLAKREGEVQIRRRDGQVFLVQPVEPAGSPLNVPAVDAGLTAAQIVHLVRESRASTERLLPPRPAATRAQATPRSRRTRRR